MQGGEDTGTLSHLNTSFVPSLRDFDLSFCTKRRFCYSPERNIIWTIFLCVPRVRDLTQKLPKKLNVAAKPIPPPSHQTLVPA